MFINMGAKMNVKLLIAGGIFILLLSSHLQLKGQAANEQFGKNRVQYKTIDWRFYSTENFDIYFYDGGDWLARLSADYLEDEFDKITDLLGYAPYFKTKIFLYNSVNDLHQSNVGINQKKFDEGGQTDFTKSHVEIGYPGAITDFKDELILNISKMLIYDMMYGGSLADMFQNAYLLNLPDWFMDGAAIYLAKGWDVTMDDYMRDLMHQKKVKNFNKYTDDEARLIGQSVWNFIAEKYGRSNISNILNLTRIIRNEEKSIANTLGVSFRQFMFEWQSYYAGMALKIADEYHKPEDASKLKKKNRQDMLYSDVSLSPDGSYLAYVTINQGKYSVRVVNLTKKNRQKKALSGGFKVTEQEINKYQPVLAWQDETTLGIIGYHYGRNYLWLYDAANNRRIKKELGRLQNIRSFDIAPGGSLAALSADLDGKNDLYLISLRRNSIKRLTNDIFDELNPRFVPNTNSIVFSSNRTTDSLQVSGETSLNDIKDNFNLFVYNIDTTRHTLTRLTNTVGNDIKPIPASEYELYYLSDQKGIYNLYTYNLNTNIYHQVSNFSLSIKDYDLNKSNGDLAFIMIDQEKDHIYFKDQFDFDNNIFTAQTARQEVINAKFVASRVLQRRQDRQDSIEQAAKIQKTEETGSEMDRIINNSTDLINTDDYTFEKSIVEETKPKESFLEAYRRSARETSIIGPLDYETRFSADNIVTSFVFDPLIGFGLQIKAQMNDLLENHNFLGGITATTDLASGRFFAEYQYLKHRFDYHLRFDREVIKTTTEQGYDQKYILNRLKFTTALPLTTTSRIEVAPLAATTTYYDLDLNIVLNNPQGNRQNSAIHYFGGFEAAYVFDNTVAKNLNSLEGTRAKVAFKHYEGLNNSKKSFSNVSLDIRNYQKIYRELVFATRFFYGRFLGQNKQNYLLGGMDNWILGKTDNVGEGSPLRNDEYVDNSNILFVEYVTSLRGFDYNTFYGSNVMLFNAELRLPIFRLLYRGPIASNLFRNFQFVGFYDIGSAWTGNSPFATENSINTEIVRGGPFEVRLKNFKNPWLSSYGFGARTVLLGYYVKLDVAYPIEDYDVKDPRFHVTLGYDF